MTSILLYGVFSYLLGIFITIVIYRRHEVDNAVRILERQLRKHFSEEVNEPMMTFAQFDSMIAKAEGKKDQEPIHNIREARRITLRLLKKMPREERNAFIERQR